MADAWGVSWRSLFRVWETSEATVVPTVPTFGPPFLDRQCALLATLGASTPLITILGTHNSMAVIIERQGVFRSPRIDKALL